MRRSILAALISLVLLAWPARAQLFPTATPDVVPDAPAVSEQTLVDATLYVNPPTREGLCFVAGPGRLTVTLRRVTDALEQRPAAFRLNGFMADPDARVTVSVTSQATTATTHLAGVGYYCWDIGIEASETRSMSMAERGSYVQTIAVRITVRAD